MKWLLACPPGHRVSAAVFTEYLLLSKELVSRSTLEEISKERIGALTQSVLPPVEDRRPLKEKILDDTSVAKRKVEGMPNSPQKQELLDQINFRLKLRHHLPGFCLPEDVKMNTDSAVFATLGFNGHHGNGEVVIILSQDLLHDPAVSISPCAGTSFFSKRAFYYQPWHLFHLKSHGIPESQIEDMVRTQAKKNKEAAATDFGKIITEEMVFDCYKRSLLKTSTEGWAEFAALQLQYTAQLEQCRLGV